MPQEVFLIDDTLKKNIVLGEQEAIIDDSRLKKLFAKRNLQN